MAPVSERSPVAAEFAAAGEHGLRSVRRSTGYHIHAVDGEIGHVDDFLIGATDWRTRHLLVDTSNWIGGRAVVISTDTVQHVDADREMLHVASTRAAIQNAPAFDVIEGSVSVAETSAAFTFI